jgi:hypothetical protein
MASVMVLVAPDGLPCTTKFFMKATQGNKMFDNYKKIRDRTVSILWRNSDGEMNYMVELELLA